MNWKLKEKRKTKNRNLLDKLIIIEKIENPSYFTKKAKQNLIAFMFVNFSL